jgi:hypothetical protein
LCDGYPAANVLLIPFTNLNTGYPKNSKKPFSALIPLHKSALTVISAGSFDLDVGIAIYDDLFALSVIQLWFGLLAGINPEFPSLRLKQKPNKE